MDLNQVRRKIMGITKETKDFARCPDFNTDQPINQLLSLQFYGEETFKLPLSFCKMIRKNRL